MTTPTGAPEQLDPPGRHRALTVLAIGLVLSMTTWFSATAVLPQLRDDWSLSSTGASWLTIAVQLGFVVGALVSAVLNLADVVAPRRLVVVGSVIAASANVVLLAADGLALAIPMRMLTGAGLALVYPPALKEMATWFRRGRGTALGVMVGALTIGSALPHLVKGVGGVDVDTVVVATTVLTLVGGAVIVLFSRDGPFPFPSAPFDVRRAGSVLRHRPVALASAGYFGHMWELYAMWAWFGAFMTDELESRGWSDASRSASLITFAVIGVGALGCWAGGTVGDRSGRPTATVAAMAVSGTCAATVGVAAAGPLVLLVLVGLVWGFAVVADSAQFSAAVTEVADQRSVGTAVTMQLAIGFTLTVVTIWLVPVVRDAWGWGWAFAMLAPGPAAGIVAMSAVRRLATTHSTAWS